MRAQLVGWERAPDVRAVLIRGAGEKAFCAGGDIRWLHDAAKSEAAHACGFFHEEYRLNAAIHHYSKPYIALIDGVVMGDLGEPARTLFRRRNLGFVYQSFNLIPTLTAGENVGLPLELNGVPAPEASRRVAEILAAVGLAARADAFPDQLSGGEQQRVAVARALVHRPRLVLADEPTGNLDAETGATVLALLRELQRRERQALLMVTHSLAVARVADRILTLADGVITDAGEGLAW